MRSYTYGRTPNEVVRQCLPHKYPMELNRNDMMKLLKILNWSSMALKGSPASWSSSMRVSILETIGIEEV